MYRALWSFAFLAVVSGFALSAEPARKPNIVFILADDLGINDLGCFGRKEHATPHLDKLAAQGTRFTSAYCAQPICSPSRAAIATGKSPARLHLTTFLPGRPDCVSQKVLHPKIRTEVALEEKTLAEHLRSAGYATGCVGKWHMGGKAFGPETQGFSFVHTGKPNTPPSETEGGKGEYDLTQAALQFIEKQRDKPFFLYLPHNNPHIPYQAKPELVKKHAQAFDPAYAGTIETLDATVGLLLAKLDEWKLAEQTIFIFTSDNGGLHVPEGPHQKITHNTPYRAGKGFLYEGGLRIPLIVRWPGKVPAGVVSSLPMVNTDWLPTLLDLVDVPLPAGLDGVSCKAQLLKQTPTERTFHWHFPHYTNQGGRPGGAVREGKWKLVEYYDAPRVELFDLEKDVSETTNQADQQPELVKKLQASLEKYRQDTKAQRNEPNPNCDAARFRELYETMDVSLYEPARAKPEFFEKVLAWRKGMNAALPGAKK